MKINDSKEILKLIREQVEQYMTNVPVTQQQMPMHDHEGKMAKSELRSMIENAIKLYNMIDKNEQLPGWVSAYITLSSDYINSVAEYLTENHAENKFE